MSDLLDKRPMPDLSIGLSIITYCPLYNATHIFVLKNIALSSKKVLTTPIPCAKILKHYKNMRL